MYQSPSTLDELKITESVGQENERNEPEENGSDHLSISSIGSISLSTFTGVWSPKGNTNSTGAEDESCSRDQHLSIEPVWKPCVEETSHIPLFRDENLNENNMKGPTSQEPEKSENRGDTEAEPVLASSPNTLKPTAGINVTSRLPQSQSPTITLLKKAREGQIPRGAMYIDENIHSEAEPVPKGAVLYDSKTVYDGDKVHTDNYYVIPAKKVETHTYRTIHQEPKKYEGIGPTTQQGIPMSLRTKVKDENVSDWYKQMYNSLHKVNYNSGKHSYTTRSGYMSEPELDYDDDEFKYKKSRAVGNGYQKHLNDKCTNDEYERRTFLPEDSYRSDNPYLPSSDTIYTSHDIYKHQPKSIVSYEPGSSSIVERELKLDDRDFFIPKSNKNFKKESKSSMLNSFRDGYESDTTLIRKGDELRPLSPDEQLTWYKEIQKGGEIPLTGLRKTMPKRQEPAVSPIEVPSLTPPINGLGRDAKSCSPPPKPEPPLPHLLSSDLKMLSSESQHKFQEGLVNIHYNAPVRTLERDSSSEQAMMNYSAMRQYDEERRKRQLKEWAEAEARKHNFNPGQKSPIPYDRYDKVYNYQNTNPVRLSVSPSPSQYSRGMEPKVVSRALYDFTAQSPRELPFSKGDLIFITKKIDKNWYEGEHHGMVGILPVKYVEILPPETLRPNKKKIREGQAKVAYTFSAQSPVELSLLKGEVLTLLRRVDDNWYEGRLGSKTGIFPASYVDVIREPGDQGRSSMSPQPARIIENGHRSTHQINYEEKIKSRASKSPEFRESSIRQSNEVLHIDTHSEPKPYRALFSYTPQNDDELELNESDTVYVMEKCDDGWFVGTSMRTGLFGTFPGNYVEKL